MIGPLDQKSRLVASAKALGDTGPDPLADGARPAVRVEEIVLDIVDHPARLPAGKAFHPVGPQRRDPHEDIDDVVPPQPPEIAQATQMTAQRAAYLGDEVSGGVHPVPQCTVHERRDGHDEPGRTPFVEILLVFQPLACGDPLRIGAQDEDARHQAPPSKGRSSSCSEGCSSRCSGGCSSRRDR